MTEDRLRALKKGTGKFLALTALVLLLFTQTSLLLHTHGADLSKHPDCELCLKTGSSDDGPLAIAATPELAAFRHSYPPIVQHAVSHEAVAAKSRSPPSLI